MAKIALPSTREDYESSGSKFITFPPGAKVGDIEYREVEIGLLDWDTPGRSMKIPVTVTQDGPDKGKEDKLSFGVDSKGIWKGKAIYETLLGKPMEFQAGADGKEHPVVDPDDFLGKPATAIFTLMEGTKGGVVGGEVVRYPKLTDLLPPDSAKPVEDLGI